VGRKQRRASVFGHAPGINRICPPHFLVRASRPRGDIWVQTAVMAGLCRSGCEAARFE
jgi:hypothetical protein